MLSSVALFHSKSGILSGLRASLVLRAKALSLGKCSIISSARSNGFKWEMCAHLVGATVSLRVSSTCFLLCVRPCRSLHTMGQESSEY